MPIKQVSLLNLLAPIGDPRAAVGSFSIERPLKWDVGVFIRSGQLLETTAFFKSIRRNVDSVEKKSNYAVMVSALFSAIEEDDYQTAMRDGRVQCKIAHSIKYANSKEHVWELKLGSKDRIYFCQMNKGRKLSKGLIILCLAYHKKDQRTPSEVTSSCETDLRQLLQAGHDVQLI